MAKGGYTVLGHQGSRHVVLGAKGVAGAEHNTGPAVFQSEHEVCRLSGYVKAGRQPQTLERLLPGESLSDEAQHLHLSSSPLNA